MHLQTVWEGPVDFTRLQRHTACRNGVASPSWVFSASKDRDELWVLTSNLTVPSASVGSVKVTFLLWDISNSCWCIHLRPTMKNELDILWSTTPPKQGICQERWLLPLSPDIHTSEAGWKLWENYWPFLMHLSTLTVLSFLFWFSAKKKSVIISQCRTALLWLGQLGCRKEPWAFVHIHLAPLDGGRHRPPFG